MNGNNAFEHEINEAVEWYLRQGKRYFYRLFHKPPGQGPIVIAAMDETLKEKADISERLRQELNYAATRGIYPLFLRVGISPNDPNPSEIPLFKSAVQQHPTYRHQLAGISGFENPGISPVPYVPSGYYDQMHVEMIKKNAELDFEIKKLKIEQENSGNNWIIELCNTPTGQALVTGLMQLIGNLTTKVPVSMAGFSQAPQTEFTPPKTEIEMPINQREEITLDELYNDYIEPLNDNLKKLNSSMDITDLLTKLLNLSNAAVKGDAIAKFKISTALNNL